MLILQQLASVIAPPKCVVCGREGSTVCADCQPRLAIAKVPTCYRCNALTRGGRTCTSCRSSSALTGVVVASHYDGAVKELIGQLKYDRLRAASQPLAAMIAPLLDELTIDAITWVPAATNRYRQRGYNQAELLAKALSRRCALPYRPLLRRVSNVQQVGHTRAERLEQMVGVFAPTAARLEGQRVLVVDDVVTTGATLNECAKVLRTMGARTVWGAVAAKH